MALVSLPPQSPASSGVLTSAGFSHIIAAGPVPARKLKKLHRKSSSGDWVKLCREEKEGVLKSFGLPMTTRVLGGRSIHTIGSFGVLTDFCCHGLR